MFEGMNRVPIYLFLGAPFFGAFMLWSARRQRGKRYVHTNYYFSAWILVVIGSMSWLVFLCYLMGGFGYIETGCDQELLTRFRRVEAIRNYEVAMVSSILGQGYMWGEPDWAITTFGEGCKAKYYNNSSNREGMMRFEGEEFFINVRTKQITPLSDGAKEVFALYGKDVYLP